MDERGKNEEEKRKKRIKRFEKKQANPSFKFDENKAASIYELLWFTKGTFVGPVPRTILPDPPEVELVLDENEHSNQKPKEDGDEYILISSGTEGENEFRNK